LGAAMTAIDFYTHVSDRHQVVTKLVAKAFAQHGSVRVLTADAASTEALEKLLWMLPATGFLPHCRVGDRLAADTPIWVDHVLERTGRRCEVVGHAGEPAVAWGDAALGRDRLVFVGTDDQHLVRCSRDRKRDLPLPSGSRVKQAASILRFAQCKTFVTTDKRRRCGLLRILRSNDHRRTGLFRS
jgi:DNA polymerase-3 subunit chi